MNHGASYSKSAWRWIFIACSLIFMIGLLIATWRNPDFWLTADQRGDILFRAGKFHEAAKTYIDPARIGTAQYRNGDFKKAAQTFARVPGAEGAFNQGNASLMHGAYDQAIASYERALNFRPEWKEAEENKAIATARRDKISIASEGAAEAPHDKADAITFDQTGDDKNSKPTDLAQEGETSDEAFRATWLRRVQTTPGDFLKAKFAYQEQEAETHPPKKTK